MSYDLYYYVPWPKSQKLQDSGPKEYWSFADCDFHGAGVFVEKEWLEKHGKEFGL